MEQQLAHPVTCCSKGPGSLEKEMPRVVAVVHTGMEARVVGAEGDGAG